MVEHFDDIEGVAVVLASGIEVWQGLAPRRARKAVCLVHSLAKALMTASAAKVGTNPLLISQAAGAIFSARQ